MNKLVLVGNGFDLAHGLKTSYKAFLDWYLCNAFADFCDKGNYVDSLLEFNNSYHTTTPSEKKPTTLEELLEIISKTPHRKIAYQSTFFAKLVNSFSANNWVDIERAYFRNLKKNFLHHGLTDKEKEVNVHKLNKEFDFIILKLSEYIASINKTIHQAQPLNIDPATSDLEKVFIRPGKNTFGSDVKFLNFNYTETLTARGYALEKDTIHIHGRVADIANNPIIFGYGDETDPTYQNIEDSGENMYLEHIKSFGYFRTGNYSKLLTFLDSNGYIVYIVGHSCGLSDRVLLNTIFEHSNCSRIEIFYHRKNDGSDNFKEITQEISRHFRPNSKGEMRSRVKDFNVRNFIPQSI
jgi:hypothetical protein